MLRTFIQFTALWLTLVSAGFLIKGSLLLSVKDIVNLSASPFLGHNIEVVRNLANQQADTRVGFSILLFSFFLQMINSLWPIRWKDFAINIKGVVISIIVSLLILGSGLYATNVLKDKTLREVNIFLEQRRTR